MRVTIMTYTKDPAAAVSFAAGVCYGKRNESERRMRICYESGHLSVFEQASVQFLIEGVSRSCTHQLVRHRLNSYCQESQRYCKVATDSNEWYVTPPAFASDPDARAWYGRKMDAAAKRYAQALASGMKREDARFLLPESCKTSVCVTMNVRNLFHFWDMRLDHAAQWEIRALAETMMEAMRANDDLRVFAELYEEGGNE